MQQRLHLAGLGFSARAAPIPCPCYDTGVVGVQGKSECMWPRRSPALNATPRPRRWTMFDRPKPLRRRKVESKVIPDGQTAFSPLQNDLSPVFLTGNRLPAGKRIQLPPGRRRLGSWRRGPWRPEEVVRRVEFAVWGGIAGPATGKSARRLSNRRS